MKGKGKGKGKDFEKGKVEKGCYSLVLFLGQTCDSLLETKFISNIYVWDLGG